MSPRDQAVPPQDSSDAHAPFLATEEWTTG